MCRCGSSPARCRRSSGRTGLARAPWSRSWPASTSRMPAASGWMASPSRSAVRHMPAAWASPWCTRSRVSSRTCRWPRTCSWATRPRAVSGRSSGARCDRRRSACSMSWACRSMSAHPFAACRWPTSSSSRSPRRSRWRHVSSSWMSRPRPCPRTRWSACSRSCARPVTGTWPCCSSATVWMRSSTSATRPRCCGMAVSSSLPTRATSRRPTWSATWWVARSHCSRRSTRRPVTSCWRSGA